MQVHGVSWEALDTGSGGSRPPGDPRTSFPSPAAWPQGPGRMWAIRLQRPAESILLLGIVYFPPLTLFLLWSWSCFALICGVPDKTWVSRNVPKLQHFGFLSLELALGTLSWVLQPGLSLQRFPAVFGPGTLWFQSTDLPQRVFNDTHLGKCYSITGFITLDWSDLFACLPSPPGCEFLKGEKYILFMFLSPAPGTVLLCRVGPLNSSCQGHQLPPSWFPSC